MIKALQTVGMEGTYLNTIKEIYEKKPANIILNGEELKVFSLRRQQGKGRCLLSPVLFNIVLEVLVTADRKEKK